MKKNIMILLLSCIMITSIFASNVYAYNQHTGVTSNVGATSWDAQARINTPLYPLTLYPSWSVNYTMITNTVDSWAQVGWATMNNDQKVGTYYFFQYKDPTLPLGYTARSLTGPAVGSSHTYLTLLDETSTYYGTVDDVTIGSHPAGFFGSINEYSGEVWDDNAARFAGASNNGLYMWSIWSAYMNGGTKVWTQSPPVNFNLNEN
jgi:hypothetical protein